jgi:DNA-binding transcriptional ArsR family regulator
MRILEEAGLVKKSYKRESGRPRRYAGTDVKEVRLLLSYLLEGVFSPLLILIT